MLKPHQQNRILSFLGLASDPLGTDYNVNQAKIAIGSGARSSGKDARDIVIPVPLGTVARNAETGETVGEVTEQASAS